ncbi:hypothetical protein RUND412_005496 [Rhizina undulata]
MPSQIFIHNKAVNSIFTPISPDPLYVLPTPINGSVYVIAVNSPSNQKLFELRHVGMTSEDCQFTNSERTKGSITLKNVLFRAASEVSIQLWSAGPELNVQTSVEKKNPSAKISPSGDFQIMTRGDATYKVVARMFQQTTTKDGKKEKRDALEIMEFEGQEVDEPMRDFLIGVWIGVLWRKRAGRQWLNGVTEAVEY